MSTYKKDYFDLSPLVSLILAIIPITSAILGIVTRFVEGKTVAGVVRLIICLTGVGAIILWICDLVMMITQNKILRIL